MASQLRVDKILPVDGAPTGGGGGIVQVMQSSSNARVTTSSSTFQETNLSVAITPKFTSSKILVSLTGECDTGGTTGAAIITIYRKIGSGSYANIAPQGGSDGSAIDANYGFVNVRGYDSRNQNPVCINYLDSANTTDALTYKVYIRALSGTVKFPCHDGYNYSFLTAYEVSA